MSQLPELTSPIYSSLADDEMMCELVEEFVAEIPERVQSLRSAFADLDLDAVQRQAHQLKGAFGSYGFSTMTEPARQLERSATEARHDLDQIKGDLETLANYCARLTAEPAPEADLA